MNPRHQLCTEASEGCVARRDGSGMACNHSCVMLAQEQAAAAEQAASVDESKHRRPALGFVQAQCIAETAAQRGLDAMADGLAALEAGRKEDAVAKCERALHAVALVADGLMPTHASDDSPGAWLRRGARDGIVRTWQGLGMDAPDDLDVKDAELYAWGYTGCAVVVCREVATERSRR